MREGRKRERERKVSERERRERKRKRGREGGRGQLREDTLKCENVRSTTSAIAC